LSCSGDSLAAQPYQRFPEVHLRFARPMHQRDEHFLAALVKLAHRLLHRSVAARAASFPQPLPHTLGRVLLLAGQVAIPPSGSAAAVPDAARSWVADGAAFGDTPAVRCG
jgi:hypothetical protein